MLPPDASFREGAGRYTSQWAEVAYFLRPTGTALGVPLFALYRRQLLVVPNTDFVNGPAAVPVAAAADYLGVSSRPNPAAPGVLSFNGPMDLTVPQRRFGMDPRRDGTVTRFPGRLVFLRNAGGQAVGAMGIFLAKEAFTGPPLPDL